ncbi:PorT family protein [Niastella caeni]|uniref:PorT family protein n=1 Tax=Niastella caeni TaxID=2569763 RepID=A0A4S8I2U9_9BACT|nr:porin family protein [Niastella caeni]THU41759.1 PorT family protein [Niastella caeni]
MKKYALAFMLFCIVAGSTQAQKITPGIKGGLNISDVSGINGDNRLSGHVGLFLNSRFNPMWSIQPEILYSGQGQQYVFLNNEYTLALSYIQIPVMFQFHPVKQFYLEFGPQLGFLLSANVKDDEDKLEVDEDYKKVDAGIAFGAGIQVTSMLGFYGRYNIGLADITKGDNRDFFNRVGQIGVSIKLK